MRGIEALRAERDAIDASGTVLGEGTALDRAGICLEGDFGIRRQRELRGALPRAGTDRARREQARRAPAEKDARTVRPATAGA